MTYDIPPLPPPRDLPPIRTQDDLCRLWRALMGKPGFSQRCLWVVFLTARGDALPVLIQIVQCPAEPERETVRALMARLRELIDVDPERHSVAFLWSRPGGAATEQADLAWARALGELAERAGLRTWPVHHANDFDLRAFAPDELAA